MSVKNLILGIGIFIVYMLMLGYGIEAFYESPRFEDYCDEFERPRFPIGEINESEAAKSKECYDQYNNVRENYDKNIFLIALIAGLITIVIGYFILEQEPVGSALIASGLGAIFYGSVRNWGNFSDVLRFLMLLLALIFLIWLSLGLNKKSKKKFWEFWKK